MENSISSTTTSTSFNNFYSAPDFIMALEAIEQNAQKRVRQEEPNGGPTQCEKAQQRLDKIDNAAKDVITYLSKQIYNGISILEAIKQVLKNSYNGLTPLMSWSYFYPAVCDKLGTQRATKAMIYFYAYLAARKKLLDIISLNCPGDLPLVPEPTEEPVVETEKQRKIYSPTGQFKGLDDYFKELGVTKEQIAGVTAAGALTALAYLALNGGPVGTMARTVGGVILGFYFASKNATAADAREIKKFTLDGFYYEKTERSVPVFGAINDRHSYNTLQFPVYTKYSGDGRRRLGDVIFNLRSAQGLRLVGKDPIEVINIDENTIITPAQK